MQAECRTLSDVNITDRGPNSVTISFSAGELLVIVNALEQCIHGASPDGDDCKRAQRTLIDALRYLRPKATLTDGRWTTDWARGEDGKHL